MYETSFERHASFWRMRKELVQCHFIAKFFLHNAWQFFTPTHITVRSSNKPFKYFKDKFYYMKVWIKLFSVWRTSL